MKWIYRIIRFLIVSVIVLVLGIPALVYMTLSLPVVQQKVGEVACTELSKALGVRVEIGAVDIEPFNKLALRNVTLADSARPEHGPIATIAYLGAGVNILSSARTGSLVINYAVLMGLNAHIWRQSPGEPLNIQPIIQALKPKEPKKEPLNLVLAINSVVIRSGAVAYDVYSEPQLPPGLFDRNHIAVKDLRADVLIPRIARDHYDVRVRRLLMDERAGLSFALTGNFLATDTLLQATDLSLQLNHSVLLPADISLPIRSLRSIGADLPSLPLALDLRSGSHVKIADLAPFIPSLPALGTSPLTLNLSLQAAGTLADMNLTDLTLHTPDRRLLLSVSARARHLLHAADSLDLELRTLDVSARGDALAEALEPFTSLSDRARSLLRAAGAMELEASGKLTPADARLDMDLASALAEGSFHIHAAGPLRDRSAKAEAIFSLDATNLSPLASGPFSPQSAALEGSASAAFSRGKLTQAAAKVDVDHVTLEGARWDHIELEASHDGALASLALTSADPAALLTLRASARAPLDGSIPTDLQVEARLSRLLLDMLPGVHAPWAARELAGSLTASASTLSLDLMEAQAHISGLTVTLPPQQEGDEPATVSLGDISADMHNARSPRWARLESSVADIYINGNYNVTTLVSDCRGIFSDLYPSLLPPLPPKPQKAGRKGTGAPKAAVPNDFTLRAEVKSTAPLEKLMKLPVSVVHPVELSAVVDAAERTAAVSVDAPYLIQGKKVIENTLATIGLDALNRRSGLYLTTVMPAKKGPVSLTVEAVGRPDSLLTRLRWEGENARSFSGDLSLDARLSRSEMDALQADVDVLPTTMTLNDTVWHVGASSLAYRDKSVAFLTPWRIGNDTQWLSIAGTASALPADSATVTLHDIDLDYIFDTLNINNVDFGGRATGTVVAHSAFSSLPVAVIDDLSVKGLAYNGAVFGDALIRSTWDHADQAITLDADIAQANGGSAQVLGRIWPVKNGGGLDLSFTTDRTTVSFLQPFMSAFCSRLTGVCSGHARLFGTFSDLDLEGKAFAQDLAMTIPFTGTTYMATDTVTFTPGNITIPGITLRDVDGHTAHFSGWLRHRAFHDPVFEFTLSDARDFLCYDLPESSEQLWYGKVYANGGARIAGRPGVVDIDVNVATAPGSSFGFILSDARSAGEYTFITFRDREGATAELSEAELLIPEAIRRIRSKAENPEENPTAFNMSISVQANPNVAVTLVMDPLAGDRIRAIGRGDLRLTYQLPSDDMQIFGTYTLERGSYNFSLQDIIVKDFTIDAGSSISFHGNPYSAQLDITAAYQTTANLTDLDESFKEDRDLNRTSVPVRAMLKITGDMRQPELAFDLNFPTLTSDIDRKVRSLVNTDEMMSRQVIYLLALNRFYTPEYNMGTTRNNEFASLATNTLSSRLSSLLGTISDNWSIAPSVRSDIGDFSDVEVDLALSSHLLNNRLLINGNLGYRDKSLNAGGFIGDFDIEYLLNRRGTIRLKAYNRFNDQTFYVKSALTTQGVGVVFTREFDNLDSWLRRLLRKKPKQDPAPADSTAAAPAPAE